MRINNISQGGGCGCKLDPSILEIILKEIKSQDLTYDALSHINSKEDCTIYPLNKNEYLLKSVDFFTPIVEDPFVYGQASAANALSDIFAKGGKPLVIQAILGWPTDTLSTKTLSLVIKGAINICAKIGVPITGGHSIKLNEPIFGLSVTGIVNRKNLVYNNGLSVGDLIYLTKGIGTGILSTSEKREILTQKDKNLFYSLITTTNQIGIEIAKQKGVKAMTDLTGFGLLCHLLEMKGDNPNLTFEFKNIPFIEASKKYLKKGIETSGGKRNRKYFERYQSSQHFSELYFDPQTNGGLMIAVDNRFKTQFEDFLKKSGFSVYAKPLCIIKETQNKNIIFEKPAPNNVYNP